MQNEALPFVYKANLGKRIGATIIDYGLFMLAFFAYLDLVGEDTPHGKLVSGWTALVIPVAWFLYFVVIETFNGATPGHHVLRLKVLTIDRKETSGLEALQRHLLDWIDIFFWGIPALIAITMSDKRQRLGDMWAHTIVVDTTDPDQYGPARRGSE